MAAIITFPLITNASWWNPTSWNWNVFNIFNSSSQSQNTTVQPSQNPSQNTATQTTKTAQTTNNSNVANNNVSIPAGWKIYTNANYNYQIAYPSNLPLEPEYTSSSILSQVSFGNGGFNLAIRITKQSMSIDQIAKYSELNLPNETSSAGFTQTHKMSDVTVGGIKGKEISINFSNKDGSPHHILNSYYINKGNNTFRFDCFYEPTANLHLPANGLFQMEDLGVKYGYDCSTMDKMVYTFKFTK